MGATGWAPLWTLYFRLFLMVLIVLPLPCNTTQGQVLNPPYFNLAEGRRITSTATCGEDVSEPELYCKLVGAHADQKDNPNVNLIQGQVCDYCDPNDPNLAHPPEYAIDGSERWWQSPPLSRGNKYNEINLTIDLGQEFHVAYVFIKMANSPRPGVWVLERSQDGGQTWQPWQQFADTPADCASHFGPNSYGPITRDDSVTCETKFSKVVPLEGGEIVVSLLNERPNANDFYNSTVLQEWTKATNIRLRFIRTKTLLGHLMSVARQDPTVTRRYFYSIRDINVGGRCVCNGHADLCDITDPYDPYKLLCRCQHNTCGSQCESCCPGFVQKAWKRATPQDLNECEPCNCFGHSHECTYDPEVDRQLKSLDIHGIYSGGGVCENCQHNTEGINCHRCRAGYYRPYGKQLNTTDVCQRCSCDLFVSTGSCADETGQCECRPEFLSPYCDQCNVGYFGHPNCRPCDCNVNGTRDTVCEVGGGQCPCKPSYTGKNCDRCARDYYGFPDCQHCNCNPTGSLGTTCDPLSGQCICSNNFGGRNCGECDDGFYDYPNCKYCNCDATGTEASICEKNTGTCLCKQGYGGARCDQCDAGYYGYPHCRKCECNDFGSVNNVCDDSGKCFCNYNFAGRLCDQCSPGYYRYPECIACNCDNSGAIGLSCDDDGRCQCKTSFDGTTCDHCKHGYYNYPACEECNCNPAGVLSTFAGCDSQPNGELCQCKERVAGRICNQCRPLFWNLQPSNPHGCEDCNCHPLGTMGGIGVCDDVSGQCFCKANVGSRQCRECQDGSYDLQEQNLFGCIDCGCDVGGAVSNICDKKTGQCICRPRISGRTCNEPLKLHYFPTLFHNVYEAEDGHTPANTPVRFGYNDLDFPGYSWRGYAVFSLIQKEVLLDIIIEKPSLYRVVLRYANIGDDNIMGSVILTPDSSSDIQQNANVKFEPTEEPRFGMANSPEVVAGVVPQSFVLNPGRWTMTIKGEKGLLLDFVVLLPSAYYEATILQERIEIACNIGGTSGKCRHYKYPDLDAHPAVKAEAGYTADGDNRGEILTYNTIEVLEELEIGAPALLSEEQTQIYFELSVPRTGRYILVIVYHTPNGIESVNNLMVEAHSGTSRDKGRAVLYNCQYSTLCRQVVTDLRGKVATFNIESNTATLNINWTGDSVVFIESIVAIPIAQWHMDFIRPSLACIKEGGKCLEGHFHSIPGSIKVEAETDNEAQKASELPQGVYDTDVGLVYLDQEDSMVDIRGRVPNSGGYMFVVHYYQTKHPEFELDVLIQNGQFYESVLPVPFCPSASGCRTIIKSKDGTTKFQILENFVVTLKEPNQNSVWIDYILAIPWEVYREDVLEELPLDKTVEFISSCGKDSFHIEPSLEGFCRNATFSLTTENNNGGLPCACDFHGSLSFECNEFGGQCQCRENIIGRRCTECRTGHYGFPECKPCNCPSTAVCHPQTGECICPPRVTGEKCDRCIADTYGFDPIIGCEECNCHPLGVNRGRLQCDLQTGECDCKPNVVTRTCGECQAGYWAFPQCQLCDCDLRGATEEICDMDTSQCFCKLNVYGIQCAQCKPGTFNLEEKNPQGCTKCFCFGKTDRCSSSSMFVSELRELEGWRSAALLLNQFNIQEYELSDELNSILDPIVVDLPFSSSPDVTYYFLAPDEYLGNKITAYGGRLRYTIEYSERSGDTGAAVIAADVILVGNNITAAYEHHEQVVEGIPLDIEFELREWNFRHWTGTPITREQLMTLLSSLDKIYLRAHYNTDSNQAKLLNVNLDLAVENYISNAKQALSVEQCQCPPNYKGTSCELCSDGHYRAPAGPYGGYCVPCQCHGHADSCDSVTGICHDCKHNTVGDHCDKCTAGFHGDATVGSPNDCLICACPLPMASNNFADSCELSPSGREIRCECQSGYIGARCDYCSPGFFGRPEVIGDFCKPCECSGNIDTDSIESCDSVTGQCLRCLNNTFGSACELCAPGYYGDAVSSKNCKRCYCDECGTRECHHQSGSCRCQPNVIGEKCEECAPGFWGFDSCEGCIACNCTIASESSQCDVNTGQCKCRPGVGGRTCDRCLAGYWNYGANGCQACKCNEDYSIGGTCNVYSGRCECLPGVEGDRCDQCPHRWAFLENVGCHACDSCVHTLLDEMDILHNLYDPVRKSLETVDLHYFAYRQLTEVNNTVTELRPLVDGLIKNPYLVDLGPLEDDITDLEQLAKQVDRRTVRSSEQANQTSIDARETYDESIAVEKRIKDVIDLINKIIKNIKDIVSEKSGVTAPIRDQLLGEAEFMLAEILARNFTPNGQRARDELTAAEDLLKRVKAFALPSDNHQDRVKNIQVDLDVLEKKLRELLNNSAVASDDSREAELLNNKNKSPAATEKIRRILATKEVILTVLEDGSDLVIRARALLNEAKDYIADLINDDRLNLMIDRLRRHVDELRDGLMNVVLDVRKAQGHANRLMELARELEGLLRDIGDSAKKALEAANAYGNIEKAIHEALEAARIAVEAANNATRESEGLDDEARDSLERSRRLLEEALKTRARVEGDLRERLGAAKRGVDLIEKMNHLVRLGLDELNRAMDRLPNKNLNANAQRAMEIAKDANRKAQEALDIVEAISGKLPADKLRAEQIPRDIDDANKAIKRASGQVDKAVGLIPELKDYIERLGRKASAIKVVGKDVGDKIEELRRKIAVAREQANLIGVGINFDGDEVLQLRNPDDLHRSATYTQLSLYAKTNEKNGFLAYIGNTVGTKQRIKRTTTDDYMALEILDGRAALTMDLGSGHKKIVNDKFLADDQWHEIQVERIGRTVTVKVRTEKEPDIMIEDTLPGTFSVFNLDQELSKFYVGGFPQDANVQTEVTERNFNGAIEEMKFAEKPLGLWNFVYEENVNNGSIERDKLVIVEDTNGVQLNGQGYVIVERQRHDKFEDRIVVVFRFKTFATNGLLFLVGKGSKYFAVQLIEGKVINQVNLGSGKLQFATIGRVNDGEWHTVEASRVKRDVIFTFDGVEIGRDKIPGRDEKLDVTDDIYVGGHPKQHSFEEVTNVGFEGCIDNLQIGATVIDLNRNKESLGVIPGCPVKVSRSVTFTDDSKGHIGMPTLPLGDEPQLTFRFKTITPNGLLFYTANREQTKYMSVSLLNGVLIMRARPGGEVQSASSIQYNDAEWHYVSATKNNSHLQLVVDDYEIFDKQATAFGPIDETTELFFGGAHRDYRLVSGGAASEESFVGCIGDATINGKFQNFAHTSDRIGAQLVSCSIPDPRGTVAPPPYTDGDIEIPADAQDVTTTTTMSTSTSRPLSETPMPLTTTSTVTITTTTTSSTMKPSSPSVTDAGQCKLPLRPTDDADSSEFSAMRYGNSYNSRSEYAVQVMSMRARNDISMSFKTSAIEGILFYIADIRHTDFLSAYVKDGYVIFAYNLGSGRQELISATDGYNDNRWHTLKISRVDHDGTVTIDEKVVATGKATGSTSTLNVNRPMYIGGVAKQTNMNAIKSNLKNVDMSLNGCIKDVQVGNTMLGSPLKSESTLPCSNKVEDGAFISADGGHIVVFDKFRVGIDRRIDMKIKPRVLSGVLLAVHNRKRDFMALQLVDGKVKFSVDNGAGIISTTWFPPNEHYLCDGQWHEIVAIKTKNVVTLSIDEMFMNPGIGVAGVSATDTNDPLYVGGMPDQGMAQGIETKEQFVGCIKDVKIDGISPPFINARIVGNATTQTCPMV